MASSGPGPEYLSTNLVRQCKNPGCLTVFTTREAVISIIENSKDREILQELAARIEAFPADFREVLVKILLAG